MKNQNFQKFNFSDEYSNKDKEILQSNFRKYRKKLTFKIIHEPTFNLFIISIIYIKIYLIKITFFKNTIRSD